GGEKANVLQNTGKCRSQIVAAHREVVRPQADSARALDRARRHAGICRADRSMLPPAPLMKRAMPPVLVSTNRTEPLLVMVALPAVVVPLNCRKPLLVMVAGNASG